MKKITILSFLALIGFYNTTYAQIEKGNVLTGADIANFQIGLNKPSVTDITINPDFGFFIKDNVAIGPYVKLVIHTVSGTTDVNYGVGGFGRYYFTGKQIASPIKHSIFFVEANFGIGGENISGGNNTNGLNFGFGPGFSYFITPSIGLETLLKYNAEAGFGSVPYTSNLNLRVGFQVYLPSKHIRERVDEMKK